MHSLAGHTEPVTSLAFSPDEKLTVSASIKGRILIHDVINGNIVKELKGHADSIGSIEFIDRYLNNTDRLEDAVELFMRINNTDSQSNR